MKFTPACTLIADTSLAPHQWDRFNKSQLERFLATHGKTSPRFNPDRPPYVVLDWDNTMVFLDVQEATLIYQLQNLRFKMDPRELEQALRTDVPTTPFTPAHPGPDGQPLSLDPVVRDIVDSYTWLYDHSADLRGDQPLESIKNQTPYTDFITKVRFLYAAIGDTFDVSLSYPWLIYLLAGHTESEVRALTREAVDWQLQEPVEKRTWTSPTSRPGQAGVLSVSWKNGLRLIPEMQDLTRALQAAGIEVWVCTASFVGVIQEIASNPAYGYHIPASRVLGMELEHDERGAIKPQFRSGYDQTYGPGKSRTIHRFLVSRHGHGPIMVAGDSKGDLDMLQDFPHTELALIINRSPSGGLAALCQRAISEYGTPQPKILLQGRDDNRGRFIPSQAHIPWGATSDRPAASTQPATGPA